MSKLLIDERPLTVQPSLAAALGSLDEATVLQQIHYWLTRSSNVRDGKKWIYNTMTDWMKQFPWIKSRKTLSGYFDDLEKRGLIVTGNFNKSKFDRTKWYSIDYQALAEFEQSLSQTEQSNGQKLPNGESKNYSRSEQNLPTDNGQKLPNGMGKNESTYTIDYTETTQETTAESTSTNAPAGKQTENPFSLAQQYRINVKDGEHKTLFSNAIKYLGEPLVCWAIHETADGPRCSWGYLSAILNRLQKDGIKTVKEAEYDKQRHTNTYSKCPAKSRYEEAMPAWSKMTKEERNQPAPPGEAAEVRAMLANLHKPNSGNRGGTVSEQRY